MVALRKVEIKVKVENRLPDRGAGGETIMRIFPANHVRQEVPIPVNDPRSNMKCRYSALMQVIKDGGGEWIACVDPNLVAGTSLKQKSIALYSAAARREIRIKTTIQNEILYVRLVETGATKGVA